MKLAIFSLTLVFSVSLVFFVRQQFTYPGKWNEIRLGMSRQEVYNLIGEGGGEMPGYTEEMHWTESHTVFKQDMDIYFDKGRAASITIVTVFAWENATDVPPVTTLRHEHAK